MVRSGRLLTAGICLVSGMLLANLPPAASQEPDPVRGIDANEGIAKLMLAQVERMTVRVPVEAGTEIALLKANPLIRYSDQERALTQSSLWVWHRDEVPVLFCKVERVTRPDSPRHAWQFCCSPALDQKVDVEWNREFRWRAKEVGVRWTPFADKSAPGNKPALRLSQLKALARQFSGEIENSRTRDRETMRLLAQPLYRYASAKQGILDGAVFGLTSNGTNPDTLLLIEAVSEATGSPWRYAVVGMSGDAVEIARSGQTVWQKPFTNGPGDHRSWLWYLSQ